MERQSGRPALPPRERQPDTFSGIFAEISAPVMAADLIPIFDDVQPDLVLHEPAELAVTPLTTSRGVPRVVIGYSGATPRAVVDAAARVLGPLWDAYELSVPADLGLYEYDYVHPFPSLLGRRPTGARVHDVRPEPPDAASERGLEWLGDLGVHRPLVYLTYGTEMAFVAPWGALLGGLAQLDVDVLATTTSSVDVGRVLSEIDGAAASRIQLRDYVPQASVLARASLVVSHAGAGTMIAAGAAGIPQVAVPFGADQFENADAFSASGAAVTIDIASLTGADVAAAVQSAIESDQMSNAAKTLADAFTEMPHSDRLAATIAAR